jgi:RNA polymerase sigma-70 factor, ECF subfamily
MIKKHLNFQVSTGNNTLIEVLFPSGGEKYLSGNNPRPLVLFSLSQDKIPLFKERMRKKEHPEISPGEISSGFREAALEHLDALFGFAMVLTRNRMEAEDLVQETYLRATRAFGRLLPDTNLKAWLFAIMRNIWLNQLRAAGARPEFIDIDAEEEADWLDPATDDPYIILVREMERETVRSAIERLPDHYREVVVLRDLEGFSYQQIAAMLQCPAGTVMSRLGRARKQLRALLRGWQANSGGVIK